MLTEIRPGWKSLGFCEHTTQIQQKMQLNPDFIVAGSHISDGDCITALQRHASKAPLVFYTHIIDEEEAHKKLPNIVKFIYEPVSRDELTEAAALIELQILHQP